MLSARFAAQLRLGAADAVLLLLLLLTPPPPGVNHHLSLSQGHQLIYQQEVISRINYHML
jgi:hypothetical protein